MTPAKPKTSSRLLRAAAAERAELDRYRERLLAQRAELQAKLEQLERALIDADDRVALLNRLVPLDQERVERAGGKLAKITTPGGAGTQVDERDEKREVLRGTAIRETAVRLLAGHPDGARPIHYRRWYELLGEAGYAVVGKDPAASFLTQVSRSPVVRKTTRAGIYELDREAPERLRHRLAELQAELRAVTGSPAATEDLAEVRQCRGKILAEIAQTERALEEAARVLDEPESAPAAAATDAA